MRIVNRKEFLIQPNGTVYSKYVPLGNVEGLYIKRESSTNDWYYVDLLGEVEGMDSADVIEAWEKAEEGKPFRIDFESQRRDGLYQEDDMFMIYDDMDIIKLVGKLVGELPNNR